MLLFEIGNMSLFNIKNMGCEYVANAMMLNLIDCLTRSTSKDNPKTLKEIHEIFIDEYDTDISLGNTRKKLESLVQGESIFTVIKDKSGNNYKENVYYLLTTPFELHELRYLMDAVSSARFISKDETNSLIYKLRTLTDEETSKRLSNELIPSDRKVNAPKFSEHVQTIHEAIKENQWLSFRYGRFNVRKEFQMSREGNTYEVKPYGVVWNQEYYYLIAFEKDKQNIIHYRIDRMRDVVKLEKKWADETGFNLKEYVAQLFHMYSGEKSNIAVEFDNHLINVVIDRFGLNASIKPIDDEKFLLEFEGIVSQGLVRWLLTWGADAKVIRPQQLVEDMKKEIARYTGLYS